MTKLVRINSIFIIFGILET